MKTTHVKNVAGLRERPTYLELIDYVENNDDKIKMPDRRAKFIRNSFYLSQLDGEGMRQAEDLQRVTETMQDRELLVRQFARDFGFMYRDIRNSLEGQNLAPVRRPVQDQGSNNGSDGGQFLTCQWDLLRDLLPLQTCHH